MLKGMKCTDYQQRKLALSGWDLGGLDGAGFWIRDWCYWRIWDTRISQAATDICALGIAADFCRSSGAVWVSYCRVISPPSHTAHSPQINRRTDSQFGNEGMKN